MNWVCFVGHSHKPGVFNYNVEKDDYGFTHLWDLADLKVDLREKGRWKAVINVGSVGQPRDKDPRAAYCVFDPDAKTVAIRRVSYDFRLTQRKIIDADLPAFLASRLSSGT